MAEDENRALTIDFLVKNSLLQKQRDLYEEIGENIQKGLGRKTKEIEVEMNEWARRFQMGYFDSDA